VNIEQEVSALTERVDSLEAARTDADDAHKMVVGKIKLLQTFTHERTRELGKQIKRGFEETDENFDKVGRALSTLTEEFGELSHRMDLGFRAMKSEMAENTKALLADIHALNGRADGHDAKLDEHGAKLDEHGAKLDALGAKVETLGAKVDGHDAKLDEHGVRLDGIDTKLDAMQSDITKILDILSKR